MREMPKESKQKWITILLSLALLGVFWGVLFFLVGKPILETVGDPERFRTMVEENGIWGRLLFLAFMIAQVLVSVIPAEPLEIGAGYAFGGVEGTILCLLGIAIGTAMVFGFVRRFGSGLVNRVVPQEQIHSYSFLRSEKRLRSIVFVLYLIPGIPKDIVTWVVPLTPIRFWDFILLSSVARIFSIATSTFGGSALGEEKYVTASVIFVITALVSGVGVLVYRGFMRAKKADSRTHKKNSQKKREKGS